MSNDYNKKLEHNVIGNSFHEMSSEEMMSMVGGNTVSPDSASPIISVVTRITIKKGAPAAISAVGGLLSYRHC
ncbi:lichenicidin A2 family type 2 lantibiotic [Leuconostoc citreum]|uniref:lichenicidin A2 family type 2 lantibiotic n=1 Tax=Leuconostoc citreum TaxID=33964 RepID=UPI000BFEB931|nr:lichenicidin A2 family type 2 lantibiotic [Leuconostoc citreum]